MSKYELLWQYIHKINNEEHSLEFSEINRISGFEIDHFFYV